MKSFVDVAALGPPTPAVDEVPNGIAYDAAAKRILVTGKMWPQLYEVRVSDGPANGAAQDQAAALMRCQPGLMPRITFHLARADNNVIGKDGRLPWHLPADLKRFKAQTMGKPMVMGRKTFESFPSPLPGRRHIVLTRDTAWSADGAEVVHSPEEALALAGDGEVAVIGGAEVFALFLDRAGRIELTEVHYDAEGDATVPDFGPDWREVAREDHPGEAGRPAWSFVTLERAA